MLNFTFEVTAAYEWDHPAQLMTMNHPIEGSLEQVIYDASDDDSLVITHRILKSPYGGRINKCEEDPDLTE